MRQFRVSAPLPRDTRYPESRARVSTSSLCPVPVPGGLQLSVVMRLTRTLAALSPFAILLSFLSFTLSDEDSDSFHPNHLYTDTVSQTPRLLEKPFFNNFPQRIPVQKVQHQRFQPVRSRNLTNYHPTPPTLYNFYPQPSKLSKVKRSGDYHYGNMDYHQYEVDDHEPLYQPHPHMPHMPMIRTTHFPRIPMFEKPEPKIDLSALGMLALMKLGMLKMMKFGFINMILMMLFKMPLILGILGLKFMILMNLVKLVKLLTLPLILPIILLLLIPILIPIFILLIPLLLPLILAPLIPLILIPILLPLLLLLPVPVLAPTAGRRRRQLTDAKARSVDEDVLYLVRRVLESEQCIERVACRLAANKQSKGFKAFVAWYLEKASGIIRTPRFMTYKDAYKKGSAFDSPQECARHFACNNPRKAL